ncbi:unknown [Bacteroides sp. CAG:98]|nr:unknown [Bacteroides sp. CAG:98]
MKNLARGQIIGKDALFECSDKQSFQYSVIIEFADLPFDFIQWRNGNWL